MTIRDLVPWNWGKKQAPAERREQEDPFRELQQRMNRLFDDFWGDVGRFDLDRWGTPPWGALGEFAPKVDVCETDDAIQVKAELPGMGEDDIQVSLDRGVLTLQGEKQDEKREETDGRTYRECTYGCFHRQIPIHCEIDEDRVEAAFQKGVLSVKLPKSAVAKERAKKIAVKSG
jgi:HSP20 family protein